MSSVGRTIWILGLSLYVIAFFLEAPSINFYPDKPRLTVIATGMEFLSIGSQLKGHQLLFLLGSVTNLAMVLAALSLSGKASQLIKWIPALLYGCAALDFTLMLRFHFHSTGYLVWLASFAVTGVGMVLTLYQDTRFTNIESDFRAPGKGWNHR
ncbi:MAG: hypothetical protein ABJA67_02955 [Chthonomonadales bacterium]